MKYLLLILLLSSCNNIKEPVYIQSTNNKEIRVELLFENEGCKVYRFEDNDKLHYYTNCSGQTMSTKSCGKSCEYNENIGGK